MILSARFKGPLFLFLVNVLVQSLLLRKRGANNPALQIPMAAIATVARRTVSMPAPNLLRIVTGDTVREYKVEVWVAGLGLRSVGLTRLDTGAVYTILFKQHRSNQRYSDWSCDCPASKYRGGQCKHILAIKAGLRSIGVKV